MYCGIVQMDPFIVRLYMRITLYDVLDHNEQDHMLATLRAAWGPEYKPVRVEFFEKEVWDTHERDGRVVSGRRGKETLLRTAILQQISRYITTIMTASSR
jgi:hypothetical protein